VIQKFATLKFESHIGGAAEISILYGPKMCRVNFDIFETGCQPKHKGPKGLVWASAVNFFRRLAGRSFCYTPYQRNLRAVVTFHQYGPI
jgi:hypothetical protein